MKIGHVAVRVPDLEKAEEFYRSLGLTPIFREIHDEKGHEKRGLRSTLSWGNLRSQGKKPDLVWMRWKKSREHGVALFDFGRKPQGMTSHIDHFEILVEDLGKVRSTIRKARITPIVDRKDFLRIRDPWGTKIDFAEVGKKRKKV